MKNQIVSRLTATAAAFSLAVVTAATVSPAFSAVPPPRSAKAASSAPASVGSVRPVGNVDHLLFCNQPERLQSPGVYAAATLRGGQTYRIFFHYRNDARASGPLVVAFQGSVGKSLRLSLRKGVATPQTDPPLAGRQALARYLKAPTQQFVGRGGARFPMAIRHWEVASGVLTVKTDQDVRFLIYFRDAKRTIPGAHVVALDTPRREIPVALKKDAPPLYFRIGTPEEAIKKTTRGRLDGTYGLVYSFKVSAPPGSRVRITFSPRGGHSGMVASVGGALFQSDIVDASQLVVFAEATVGKNGLAVTTIPFGGVFYPVEVAFHLL